MHKKRGDEGANYWEWSREDLIRRVEELEKENERLRGYGTVVERRPYQGGWLQLEYRRNKKTGTLSGPYWQFRYLEGGKQKVKYIGKTENPETVLNESLDRGG